MSIPTPSYLFYDLETTGLNKCFDQILQFAAIRTDRELNELERFDITIQLNPDVIPSPAATITHRISIADSQKGISEWEAVQTIHRLLNTPATISIGYNTLGFDDEFLRFSFYRNLLPPYTHQFANECYRMDVYPIALLYFLFKPDVLKWPTIDSKPSLKLEHLSNANQLATGPAHNALVDVEATLALARKLFQERDMWDFIQGYFIKETEIARMSQLPTGCTIANIDYKEGLFIQGSLGAEQYFQTPVLGLGSHQHYKNQTLWLRLDTELLSSTTAASIADTTYVIRKKRGEPGFVLPPHSRFLKYLSSERQRIVTANKQWLCDHPELFAQIKQYYRQYTYPTVEHVDVDAALYDSGFPSAREELLFRQFHEALPADKPFIAEQFPNEKRKQQAIRILGRHFPDTLSEQQALLFADYLQHINPTQQDALIDYRGETRLTPTHAKQEIAALLHSRQLDTMQLQLLEELNNYLEQLNSSTMSI